MTVANRKRVLGYLAEDIATLGEPPTEAENWLAWCSKFRDVQDRATQLVTRRGSRGVLSTGLVPVVRSLRWKRCESCYTSTNLTLHHCVPVAVGGKDRDSVTLCRGCHNQAHALWGPGDAYRGPPEPRETLRQLRRHLGCKTQETP